MLDSIVKVVFEGNDPVLRAWAVAKRVKAIPGGAASATTATAAPAPTTPAATAPVASSPTTAAPAAATPVVAESGAATPVLKAA